MQNRQYNAIKRITRDEKYIRNVGLPSLYISILKSDKTISCKALFRNDFTFNKFFLLFIENDSLRLSRLWRQDFLSKKTEAVLIKALLIALNYTSNP